MGDCEAQAACLASPSIERMEHSRRDAASLVNHDRICCILDLRTHECEGSIRLGQFRRLSFTAEHGYITAPTAIPREAALSAVSNVAKKKLIAPNLKPKQSQESETFATHSITAIAPLEQPSNVAHLPLHSIPQCPPRNQRTGTSPAAV